MLSRYKKIRLNKKEIIDPRKKGSKRDKPIGTPIKCWNNTPYGRKQAQAMHRAIGISQSKSKKK